MRFTLIVHDSITRSQFVFGKADAGRVVSTWPFQNGDSVKPIHIFFSEEELGIVVSEIYVGRYPGGTDEAVLVIEILLPRYGAAWV